MKIAIRMDDITLDMDWKKFEELKGLLDEYEIKPLIGVVPDNRDENLRRGDKREDFWQYVKGLQEAGWVIALHGYRHVYTTKKGGCFPLNHFSEFAGISYEKQLDMLTKGMEILKENGIETDWFMAPAHSYDRNTLKALYEVGIRNMTDGFGDKPYQWRKMTFYPISFRLENSLKKEKGFTTMVIHANTMNEKDMEKYRQIFAEHSVISYSEYLKEQPVKRSALGHVAEYWMAIVKHLLVKFL